MKSRAEIRLPPVKVDVGGYWLIQMFVYLGRVQESDHLKARI